MLVVPVSRRAFLRAAGATAAGVLAARAVVASSFGAADTQGATGALTQAAIDELAASLDYDVERILRFVADEIAYEPYPGVLRGAPGTLESRAGNSADKAALLAALLAASLVEYRFAEGALTDDAAELVRQGWLEDPAAIEARASTVLTVRASGPGPGSAAAPSAPPIGALPADARALVERALATQDAVLETASGMVDRGVRQVLDALATRGIAIPEVTHDLPVLERDRHVWVRVRQGTEWVDLDPTLVGSQPGQVIATPSVTDHAALPDDLRHRVELRVTVERIAGSALVEEVILEHLSFADELAGLPLVLGHEKPEGLKGMGLAMDQLLTGTSGYQPVLQVGDRLIVGLVGVVLQAGGGLLDELGPDDASRREGLATAERLEVVSVSPDGNRTVADRVLFDRVGMEARAAGPIDVGAIPLPELTPPAPDGPPEFAPLRAIHFLAVATGSTSPRVADDVGEDDGSVWPLHVVGHLYHMGRDAAAATIAPTRGVRMYHDAPNVTRYVLEADPDAADGAYTASLDILARSFGTLPVVGRPAEPAPGVVAGVLSHVVERVTMGAADPTDPDPDPDISVGAILERAAAQGIATIVLAPGDDIAGLHIGAQAVATLRAALDQGVVAIGPERPVTVAGRERMGWWLFDPVTGHVTDRLDDGRGIAMVENILTRYAAFLARHPYLKLGLCIALTVKAIVGMFEGMSGGNPAKFVLAVVGYGGKLRSIACA
jgi:hypothetical protein